MWITIHREKGVGEHRIKVKCKDVEMIIESLKIKNIVASKGVCAFCKKYLRNCIGCPLNCRVPNRFVLSYDDSSFTCVHKKNSFIRGLTNAKSVIAEMENFDIEIKYLSARERRRYRKAITILRNARRRLRRALSSPNRHRKYR